MKIGMLAILIFSSALNLMALQKRHDEAMKRLGEQGEKHGERSRGVITPRD